MLTGDRDISFGKIVNFDNGSEILIHIFTICLFSVCSFYPEANNLNLSFIRPVILERT